MRAGRLRYCSHRGDGLDLTRFATAPKWVAGFSDVTVLNSHLLAQGYASIHGVMPVPFYQPGGE